MTRKSSIGMRKAKRVKKPRNANRIPVHIGLGFESEFRQLLSGVTDNDFKTKYLLSEVFSKYLDDKACSPKQREENAIKKWLSVERNNSKTNVRLYSLEADFGWIEYDVLLCKIRGIIARILGPLDYPACLMRGGHTNGASTRVSRSPIAAVDKLTGQAHISESVIKHWLAYASGTRLSAQDLGLRQDSELFTVPKKSEIDRVACKEPEINMFLQRSLGLTIRRRLRRIGIDLNDQTVNQDLAKRAYAEGLATVDLSSASDCVTRSLVTLLLPFEWWSILDDLRCKSSVVNGDCHELEMFSSMGNGFTFELESLIFYAITKAVCDLSNIKGQISVYGDDIIVANTAVPRLSRVLSWFGFTVNLKKTHHQGGFRESCGKHYHYGRDVTPFYLRGPVKTKIDMINILNKLLQWEGSDFKAFTSPEFLSFHHKWAEMIPQALWGGTDIDDPTALVTGHRPRKRLTIVTDELTCDDNAKLSQWFIEKESQAEPLEVRTDEMTVYRISSRSRSEEATCWAPYLLLAFTSD